MKIDCNNLLYLRDKKYIDMRLKSLSLKNMRLFGEVEQTINFREDKNVTIIVGNNSTGKSSILDSISIQISSLLSHFPGQSVKQYQETDVHIDEFGNQSQYLNVKTELTTTYNGPVLINRSRKGSGKASETDLKQAKHYADLLMDMVNDPNQEARFRLRRESVVSRRYSQDGMPTRTLLNHLQTLSVSLSGLILWRMKRDVSR